MHEFIIELDSLSYYYPRAERPALRNVTLTVRRGEFLGVIGPSGAGKSTLCLALSGLIPQSLGGRFFGSVRIAGLDTVTTPLTQLARLVGLVFEDPELQLLATTVEGEVVFALENLALPLPEMRARVHEALAQVGLSGLERRAPQSLSGGQKQRLAIAVALALRPPVLVLDEPTAQLDPQGAEEVFAALRALHQRGLTIVVASHAAEALAASAQRLALLDEGALVALGTPTELYGYPERVQRHRVRAPQVAQVYAACGWRPAPVCWTEVLARPDRAGHAYASEAAPGIAAVTASMPEQADRAGHASASEAAPGIAAVTASTPEQADRAGHASAPEVAPGIAAVTASMPEQAEALARPGFAWRAPAPQAEPLPAAGPFPPPLLTLDDVSFVYPNGTIALQGVSLQVRRGEFVALLGANGAGKTTLVRLVMGLLRPTQGCVRWEGQATAAWSVSEMARRIGYVAQQPERQLFGLSVEEEIAFALRYRGLAPAEVTARVEEALRRFDLWSVRDRLPLALPRGERARVALAAMLALRPQMLVLDEPTVGQDEAGARAILEVVRSLHAAGMTVVLVTHHVHLLPGYAQRAVVLQQGRVVLDAPLRAVLHAETELRACGLQPPQVVLMARAWGLDALTPEELAALVCGGGA